MTVASIIKHEIPEVITAGENDDFLSMSVKLSKHNIGVLVVMAEDGRLKGIISERDLVRTVAERGRDAFACRASDMMTKKVFFCTRDETDTQIMMYMVRKGFRHMPLLDGERVVGMVSLGDAASHRLIKIYELFEELGPESGGDQDGRFTKRLRATAEPNAVG